MTDDTIPHVSSAASPYTGTQATHTRGAGGGRTTYPADLLQVGPALADVLEGPIEVPGEHRSQQRVMPRLAGQEHALAHGHVHVGRRHRDLRGLWGATRFGAEHHFILTKATFTGRLVI